MVKVNRRIAALVGLGGVAALATPALAQGLPGRSRTSYLDRVAEALGIERSRLDGAIESARSQALQDLVDAGQLTQEQADQIRERGGRGLPGGRGFPGRHGHGYRGPKSALGGVMTEVKDAVNAATASTLGYADIDALKQDARGKFLVDLAAEKGVSIEQLEQARRAAAQPIIDGLVNDETLTREQADQMLEHIAQVSEPSGTARAHAAVRQAMQDALANQLGYNSAEELAEAVKGGTSLRALAEEKGVTTEQLRTAQQEAASAALDDLVSAGTLTREQADAYLERLTPGRRSRGRSGYRPGGSGRRGFGRGYRPGGPGGATTTSTISI